MNKEREQVLMYLQQTRAMIRVWQDSLLSGRPGADVQYSSDDVSSLLILMDENLRLVGDYIER